MSLKDKPLNKEALFGKLDYSAAAKEWEDLLKNRSRRALMRSEQLEKLERELKDSVEESRKKEKKPTELNTKETQQYSIPPAMSADEYPWGSDTDVWNGSFNPNDGIFETAQTQYSKRRSILSRPLSTRTPEEQRYLDMTTPIKRRLSPYASDITGAVNRLRNIMNVDSRNNNTSIRLNQQPVGSTELGDYSGDEISTWAKDVFANVIVDKNDTEILKSIGTVTRAREKQNYLKQVDDFLNYISELGTLKAEIENELDSQNLSYLTSRYAAIKELADRYIPILKEASTYDYETPSKSQYVGTSPSSGIGIYVPNNSDEKTNNKILNLLNDYLNNLDGLLNNVENRNKSIRDGIDLYNNYVENTVIPAERAAVLEDINDLKRINRFHEITPEFKARAEAAKDMRFLDLDTYLYGMWGTIGSSASYNGFLLLSQALKIAGAATSIVAPEVGIPLSLAGGAVGIEAGKTENDAEVAENYTNSLIHKLERADKLTKFVKDAREQVGDNSLDIKGAILAFVFGDYVPKDIKIREIAQNAAWGANNLFENDMMAVAYSEAVESAISAFVPLGSKIAKSVIGNNTKRAIGRKLVDFTTKHPSTKGFVHYATGMLTDESGYAVGATVSPIAGAATAAAAPAVKKAFRPLVKKVGDAIMYSGERALAQADKVLTKRELTKGSLSLIKRLLGIMAAEGEEEGKQYLHGLIFENGGYKGDAQGLIDIISNDIEMGSRAAYSFIGGLFFGMETDPLLLANMRGGIILPMTNHSTIVTTLSTFGLMYKDIQADKIVANNVMAMKASDRLDILNAQSYAKAARKGNLAEFRNAFDKMYEIQNKLTRKAEDDGSDEIPAFTKEEVNEQRELFERVVKLANSGKIRGFAELRGIDTNSNEYDTYVALLSYFKNLENQSLLKVDEIGDAIKKASDLVLSNEEFDVLLDNGDNSSLNFYHDVLNNWSINSPKITVDPQRDDESDEDYQMRTKAEYRNQMLNAIQDTRNEVDQIAELSALFEMKEQLELFETLNKTLKKQLSFVNQKLAAIKKDLQETGDKFNLSSIYTSEPDITGTTELDSRILDEDAHNLLKDLYRQLILYAFDYQENLKMQHVLVGIDNKERPILSDAATNSMINRIYTDIYNSRATTKALNHTIAKDVVDDYLKAVKKDDDYVQSVYDEMQVELDLRDKKEIEELQLQLNAENQAAETVEEQVVSDEADFMDLGANKKLYNAPTSSVVENKEQPYTEEGEVVESDRKLHKNISKSTKALLSNILKIQDKGFSKPLIDKIRSNVHSLENAVRKGAILTPGEQKILSSAIARINQFDSESNKQQQLLFDQQLTTEPITANEQKEDVQSAPQYTENLKKYEDAKKDADDALSNLKRILGGKSGKLFSGIDPEVFTYGGKLVAAYVRMGYYKFAEIAPLIIEQLGSEVSKFIKTWYVSVKYSNAVENADLMDSIDTILDIDVDDILSVNASETKSWFFDINLRVANLGLLIEKTDNVEEADKLLYQDIKVLVQRFQEYANKIDDYKSIDDILSYFDDLVARKNTLVKGIDDLFNKINDLYEYAINPITNRSRNQSGSIIRTYESQSYTATGGVHTFTRLNNTVFESNNKEVEIIEDNKKVGTVPMSHFRELMANKDFLTSARFVVNPLSYVEARRLILSSPKSFTVDVYYTETMDDGKLRHLKVSDIPIVLSTNKEDLNNLISKLDSLLLDINLKTGIAKLKDNVEPVLLVDASRTNGIIIDNEGYPISKNNGNQSLRTITDAFHIPSDKLADLLTGNEYGQLGIAVRGNIMPIRHNNNQSSVPIIGFREGQGRVSGIVTYVMNLMYQEDGLEYGKHRIPIPLTPKQLTEDDVDLIIKCLNNYHTTIDFEINGKTYNSPLLGRQIISLLVRFGRGAEILNNNFVFDFARNDDLTVNYKKVRISDLQRQSDNSLSKVVRIVDLNDAQQVQWLKYRLLGKAGESSAISVHYNDEFIMWHRTNDPDSVFKNLTLFFKTFNGEKGRAKIDHIRLSDSVQFDRSDVDPTNDNSYNGITALEWKIKNGHFLTAFNHIELPIISFNNANSESEVSSQTTGFVEDTSYIGNEEQNPSVDLEVDESDSIFEMYKIQSEEVKNPIDRERAIKRIHKILGKKFPVRFVQSLIQLTQNGQAAVGYMSAFCKIILSDLAEEGTEFHEAFHEVFEFLIGEKRRQRIYTHYKNKYGKGRNLTPTQISEELADMFMAFRNKVRDIHFTWNLKDTFNEIRSWANAFSELNDRKLAWLFFLTSVGVFRLSDPESRHTQERIDAFVKRHLNKQLYSTISLDGEHIELKNIKSRKHLNDLLDLLVRKIIETNKNDLLGLNIKSIKLDKKSIQTDVLAKDKELAKIQKAISENSKNVPHSSAYRGLVGENLDGTYKDDAWLNSRSPIVRSNVLAYREIFENWGKIQSLLVTKIEALGGFKTKFVKYEQVESNLNEDSSNGSQIYDDIVSHDDGFYEFSRENDVGSAVRFLFSTIPAYRYATEEDIKNGTLDIKHRVVTELTEPVLDGQGKPIEDKNGKVKRSRILVPISVNSAGGAPFLSFKEVYQPLLKLLYNVKDVDDLQRRLQAAGNNNYVMSKIASALQTFRYKSIIRYNSDEHKELKDIPMVYYHNGVLVDPTSYINNVGGGLTHDELYMKYPVATRDLYDANGLLCRKGERIPGAFVVTNPDYESYTTLIFQAIKSLQLNFTFIFQNEVMDGEGRIIPGAVTYDADYTNSEYSQFHYPNLWFLNFLTLFNDALLDNKSKKPQTLSNVAKLLRSIMTDVTSENLRNKVKLEGEENTYDYNTTDGFDKIVTRFITLLNSVGITIDRGMFDYMLLQAFPFDDSPQQAFIDLLTDRSTTSMYPLIEPGGVFETMQYNLNAGDIEKFTKNSSSKISQDGQPTGYNIYSERGFIKYLALWYGRYKSASQEMQAIGPENTKLYMFAENHSASDILYDINQTEVDKDGNIFGSTVMKDMSKVDYVTTIVNDEYRASSLLYKEMTKKGENERHDKLKLNTISGFKSSLKKDGGVKYVKLTPREVWLSRASLLSRGDIIFPTLSDKSSWFSISGINVPGLNYTNISSQDLFRINYVTGKMYLSFLDGLYGDNDILDQFIDYAWCDYKSALKVHEQLRTNEIPDGEKVKGFHTGTKNGERLAFLIGVWTDVYDERGNIVGEKYISFNNNKNSIEDNLALAYKTFFEQREGESYNQYKSRQRSMIANNLQHRLKAELDNLVLMGIIEEVPDNANFIKENYNPSTGQYDKKITKLSYQFKYRNKFLDYNKIKVIANVYKNLITNKGFKYGDIYTSEQIESLAICAYVFDINNRAIMSQQEAQRFFTGMPHFFNWKYDKNTGDLIDMRADESKRYGGVGSTGANNRSDLPNISDEYTCAEIKDYEVKSALYNQMYEMFKDNEYRDALVNTLILKDKNADYVEIYKKVYDRNGEYSDLNKVVSELDESTIKIVKHKIEAESNSYVNKINVADGAAYITDKMAENLLRQLGKYTNEVDKAFRYLRGDKKVFYTGKDGKKHVGDYLKDSDAYRVIVDALISTQKYSAFGYRMEHGIPVHFYNKFALFPLFKSISYGFTYELYKKMNDPEYGVDMVMFESAVKSGSEGALVFNPDIFREDDDPSNENNFIGDIANQNWKPANYIKDFTFKGHTYKLKYSFIRRQLNTDPREEETMALGTQVLKVMLATIKLQNDYNGVKGIDIRDNIMNSIVELSKMGATNIANKFLKRDGSVDLFKFSAFLKQELMLRDADLNILDAIEIVLDVDENGKPIEGSEHFRAPLDSVSNMKWIESILISNINKEVIDVNLPGNAYYQRSVFGMEGTPITAVLDDEDIHRYILNDGEDLALINEKGTMDAVISYDYFCNMTYIDDKGKRHSLIPENIKYNFEKGRQWLIDNGIIGRTSTANTIGYRIPTQALASVNALRFVDVINSVRDTIILPKEFTKLTGSDFDIDKLYLASFNFTKGKDGKITIQFDDANYRENDNPTNELNFKDLDLGYLNWKPKNERYRQAHIQNQLFGNFINLLKTCGSIDKDGNITYGTNMHILKRSIDNDTDLLNGEDGVLKIVDEAYSDSSSSIEEPFAYGSLSTLVNIMNAFITGKFGIGPFALHNNSHILTQLYQLSFRDGTNILNYLDALSLHEYIDKDGNSILSYLSALINANVDVAKDPYIQRLNVNLYTYDLITLLTRTGLGRNSFFFINQPVIRDLAVTYQNALGLLTESPELSDRERAEKEESDFITGKNFGKLLNDLISNSLNKFRSEKERTDASFSNKTIYRALFGENGVIITNTKGLKVNKSILEDILTNEDVKINPNKKLSIDNLKTDTYYLIKEGNNTYDLSPLEVQGFVYLAKREFNTYSEALSNLVQVTKIDTKKHGISELELSEYLEKYLNLKKNGYRIFDKHLTDLLEKSFINFKTITAIQLLSKLMNNMTISHTRTFKNMVSTACSMMNNYKKEFKKAISDGIIAYLKLKCVNDYMRENNIDWTSMIVHGNVPTLAERYIKIMDKIKNDFTGSYQSFIMNGVVLNSILDNLQRVAYSEPYGYDHYDLLTLGNTNDDSQEILNHFIDDWTQLYESSDEEIKQFAIDLAVYAFMTSADTRGFTKFFKYVPLTIREAIGYTDKLENIRYAFSVGYNDANVDDVLEEVIRNLWLNNNVIPTEELYKDVFDRDSASTVRVDVVIGPKLTYKDIKKNKGETELYDRTDTFLLFAGITSFENGARLSIKQGSDGTYRRFIKIRRPGSRITDADPYLLYEFVGVGYNDIKGKNGNIIQSEYPMYAITYPKGFTVRVGNQVYSLYEYGRNDHYKHIINEDDFLRPDYQALIEYNMQKLTELKQMFPNDVLLMSNNDDVWKLLEKVESLFGTLDYHDGVIAGNYFLLDNPVRNRLELRMARDMYRIQEVDSDIFGPVTSNYNRSQVEKDTETLYIFTDNTDRSSGSNLISENNPYSWYLIKYGSDKPLMYPTKTQAVIRGLDNAYPISTQRHFNLDVEEGRWNDEDIEEFKQVIDDEIEEIRAAWDSGRYKRVRFGLGDGFFNSNISNISKERTPEIYKYLMRQLSDLESYITGEAPTKFKPDFEDDYEFMNEPQVLPIQGNIVQSKQQSTINIYAGTGENADLSNFAERPFVIPEGFFVSVPSMRDISYGTIGINDDRSAIKYRSVEAAFQGIKSTYSETDYPTNTDFEALRKQGLALRIQDFAKMSGAEARKNGRNVTDLDKLSWDKDSSIIMKALIKLSFEQNPQALQRLLATDNATLTHTQDNSKWGTEFPRLLMEVRDELRQSSRQQQFATEEFYTKQSMQDYVNDLINVEGISRDNIEIQHVPETDTEDEYWTVSVKDNSNDWNNSDEYSDEEMNHCK